MKKTFTFHTRSRLWILCAAVCMVWAVPLHAQTRRISLNLKNATIQQAVIALQQQGYSLSVKADDVDMKAPVDIHARNEELQAVVDRIFAGQDVNCIINDKSILITKVPSQPSSEDSPQTGERSERTAARRRHRADRRYDGRDDDRCLRKFPDQGEVRGYAGLLVYRLRRAPGKGRSPDGDRRDAGRKLDAGE